MSGEALAILCALLADFRAWGQVHTVTTLDSRLQSSLLASGAVSLPADEIVIVPPGQYEAIFSALLRRSDAALIIAPETDGVLTRLSATVIAAGIPLLGSQPAAIAIAADKLACYQRFRQAGLPTPLTLATTVARASHTAAQIGYPLVTKPLDAVACEGICLVRQPSELPGALELLQQTTRHSKFLLQRFVDGTHASVSLLVADGRALPLSLNAQHIEPGCPFTYHGGAVPLSRPAATRGFDTTRGFDADRAFDVACAAVQLLPGLQGYVGVDLILTPEEAWLIEINPRLTTSYIGLRQVLDCNLAQAIWHACRRATLPSRASLRGQATFTKNDPSVWRAAKEAS